MLAYISSSQSVFQDIYQPEDKFPLYFALIGSGVAAFINSQLVMRMRSYQLAILALTSLVITATSLLGLAVWQQGIPTLTHFLSIGFIMFFCIGILFGNLNSMAMLPLGNIAGLGAAFIGSWSNIIAVIVAVTVCRFYNETLVPILIVIVSCALLSLLIGYRVACGENHVIDSIG